MTTESSKDGASTLSSLNRLGRTFDCIQLNAY